MVSTLMRTVSDMHYRQCLQALMSRMVGLLTYWFSVRHLVASISEDVRYMARNPCRSAFVVFSVVQTIFVGSGTGRNAIMTVSALHWRVNC